MLWQVGVTRLLLSEAFEMNAHFGLLAVVAAYLITPQTAYAGLGGRYASVVNDSTRFRANLRSTAAVNHVVHQLNLENGDEIREFCLADGTVFAVAWRGASRPDLRLLLGPKFDVLQADNAPLPGRFRRRALSVMRSDFVVQTGGHPGAVFGVAYLPKSLPQGVTPADLH